MGGAGDASFFDFNYSFKTLSFPPTVIAFLRWVGLFNAAVWLGSAIFLTVGAAPAFFSDEMKALLGPAHPAYAGAMVQVMFTRFFTLQFVCGTIAATHLVAEWIYLGRAPEKLAVGLVGGLLLFSLLGSQWVQPKLRQFHATKYGKTSTPEQREEAAASMRMWHAASQIGNLAALAGLAVFFWRTGSRPEATRFASSSKFRAGA